MTRQDAGAAALIERVTHGLIHRAARAAPASLSERLQEEWLADLQTRRSPLSRLRFAIGCCWATTVIARELHESALPVTGTPLGGRFLADGLGRNARFFSRRSMVFLLVAGLHVGLFYALMSGLAYRIIKEIPSTLQTRIIDAPHPHELPRLPPMPTNPPTVGRLEIPPPEFVAPQDRNDSDLAPVVPHAPQREMLPPQSPPALPAHVSTRVQGGPGSGFPNPDDYYPSLAKHMEEQGAVTLRVCVDATGRLTAEPTMEQGSGSARLDAGALKLAKAGAGHYRPTLEDGRPVDSCYSFRVRFQLKN